MMFSNIKITQKENVAVEILNRMNLVSIKVVEFFEERMNMYEWNTV